VTFVVEINLNTEQNTKNTGGLVVEYLFLLYNLKFFPVSSVVYKKANGISVAIFYIIFLK